MAALSSHEEGIKHHQLKTGGVALIERIKDEFTQMLHSNAH
jgi:hypothetical protein